MHGRGLALAVWALVSHVPATPAPSQQARQPAQSRAPVFTVDVELVNVTLSVRDEAGKLVTDLGADDFTVYEDGRPQPIRLFAQAESPSEEQALTLDLGMLFDTSESMVKELPFAQEAASRFLESIPRARDLLTIFFDQDIRVSRYDSEHQQGLFARIFETKGGGNTALRDAIAVYVSRVDEKPGRKILVLFSDGEDSTSAVTLQDLLALVRSSNVTIYPIAFTGSFGVGSNRALASRTFLAYLAELTGGQVFTPRTSKDLPVFYDKILEELKAQYVIGFSSDNPRRDGKYRKLKIEVKRPGLNVRARKGYSAPDDRSS